MTYGNIKDLTDLIKSMFHSTLMNGGASFYFNGNGQQIKERPGAAVVGDGRFGFHYVDGATVDGVRDDISMSIIRTWKKLGFDGFGFWIDPETEALYVDPFDVIEGKADVRYAAQLAGEKSVYWPFMDACSTIGEALTLHQINKTYGPVSSIDKAPKIRRRIISGPPGASVDSGSWGIISDIMKPYFEPDTDQEPAESGGPYRVRIVREFYAVDAADEDAARTVAVDALDAYDHEEITVEPA